MVKRVTFSAIGIALTVIFLYAASALSTGKLAALALSSLLCGACICQYGIRYGMTVYIGSSILALLLIPNRMFTMIYVLFIGYYPVIKLLIERLNKRWLEWVLKVLFFNIILFFLYMIFKLFFMPGLDSALVALALKYAGWIVVGLEIVFVLYDLAFSYMIGYFNQFLRRISRG